MQKQTTPICPLCDGTGWRPVDRGGLRAVEACSCRTQPRSAAWWMEQAQIPPRFRNCDFEDFQPMGNSSLEMAKMKAQSFAKQYPLVEKGLLLLGNPGVGKTHLMVATLRELMLTKNLNCLFCSFPDMLEKLQESYDPISQLSKAEILEPILHTDVVAIDDLGARRISDWVEDTVTYILNFRYNQKKATLLTTNLPESSAESAYAAPAYAGSGRSPSGKYRVADTLQERIGIRVYSRLFEMCERVTINASDFRQDVQQHARRFV
ncbi:MAG: AAA family ATPase [Acidobacteria bacterium]|nr:AAA family ATPase [Acidobacteriota bacterium]